MNLVSCQNKGSRQHNIWTFNVNTFDKYLFILRHSQRSVLSSVLVCVRPPGRRRRPAGGGHAVWEQTRARHGSDLLPQHAGASRGPGAPPLRVHPHAQRDRLPQRSGVPDRKVLRRHPRHQMSSDGRGGESLKSGEAKRVELFKALERLGGGHKHISLSAHGSPVCVVVNPSDIFRYCDYSSTCSSRIVLIQTLSVLRLLLDNILINTCL